MLVDPALPCAAGSTPEQLNVTGNVASLNVQSRLIDIHLNCMPTVEPITTRSLGMLAGTMATVSSIWVTVDIGLTPRNVWTPSCSLNGPDDDISGGAKLREKLPRPDVVKAPSERTAEDDV